VLEVFPVKRLVRSDLVCSLVSFLFGLFAIPVLVFSGGSLLLAVLFGAVAIGAGMAAMKTASPALRALSWAGFVMGVADLWYAVTGWAVSLDIAASIESLF